MSEITPKDRPPGRSKIFGPTPTGTTPKVLREPQDLVQSAGPRLTTQRTNGQIFSAEDLTATRISAETMKIRWEPADLSDDERVEALARAVSFVKLLVRIDRETAKLDQPST